MVSFYRFRDCEVKKFDDGDRARKSQNCDLNPKSALYLNDHSDDDVKINFLALNRTNAFTIWYHNTPHKSQLYSNLPELNGS